MRHLVEGGVTRHEPDALDATNQVNQRDPIFSLVIQMASSPATGDAFGDFQAGVGRIGANVGEVFAWILLLLCVLVGVAVGVVGQEGKLYLNSKKDGSDRKAAPPWAGWAIGGGVVSVGIIILCFQHWWNRFVHSNKTAAEIGGTLTEFNVLNDMLHR